MTKRLLAFILPLVALVSVTSCEDAVLAPDEAASQIEVVSGNSQSGRVSGVLASPVVVRVLNKSGTPVVGATVRFVPDTGSGSVSLETVLTDAEGRASVTWTLGSTFGTKTLHVEAGTSISVSVNATVVPDRLELVSGNNQLVRATGELPSPIVVQLVDLTGKPAVGVTVAFQPATGGGTVVPSVVATGTDGMARALWTLGSAVGPTTMRVSAASATSTLTINATATQDKLSIVSGGNQSIVAGATLPQPIVVQLRDQTGVAVKGVQVTFTPPAGSGTVSPSSVFTDASGQAQTNWTLGSTAGAQTVQVTGGSATAIAVAAAALGADSLQVVSGNAQAGRAASPLASPVVVRVLDRQGRVVRGAVVRFAAVAGNGAPTVPVDTTDEQGLAQTGWVLGSTLGAMQLTATVGTATPVTISATATQDRLVLESGGLQVGRVESVLANPVVVQLIDLHDDPVAGAVITFTPDATNGTVLPVTVATDATGRARTLWTMGATAGPMTLRVASPTSQTLVVTATAAQNRVTLVSGGSQSARINAALADSIAVKVVDPNGAAVPNVTVTFAASAGTASPLTGATDAQGMVKTRWTMGATAGAVTLTASAPSTDALSVTARALKADSVFLSAGGSQTAYVGAVLPQEIVVEVRDKLSQVVMPGITVTFTPTAGSGSVNNATVVTDTSGLARTTWTLGTTKGTKTLNVSTVDAGALSLTATALQDTSRVFAIGAGNNQTGTVQRTLTDLRVTVRDRFNNAIVGDTIRWTDSLTNGVTVSPTVSVTDANGEATTTPRLGVAVDSALIRARIMRRTETVTFLATGQIAYSAVQTGNFFSCALTDEGRSYCWGFNRDGQLAKSSAMRTDVDRPSTPITATDSLLGPFPTLRSLSLGRTTACGISVAKRLVCWGTGSGNFGTTTPTGVTFTPAVTVEAVATGEAHTCFIDIDGFGWCGGENRLGQLGNRSTTATTGNSAVNVINVVGGVAQSVRLSAISAGRSFTCGFIRGTTLPQCWGDNGVGQLGRASAITHDSVPASVSSAVVFDTTSLVTGLQHACALSTAGAAHCWGGNGFGQLGDGTTTDRNAPAAVGGGLTFVRLAAGEYHTCGITAAGAVHCWGRNTSGQLGDGTIVSKSSPTAVTLPTGVTFRALGLGELHSCAIAGLPSASGSGTTTATGAVYCWGDNEYGQLGDGAASGNNTPVLTPKKVVNQP